MASGRNVCIPAASERARSVAAPAEAAPDIDRMPEAARIPIGVGGVLGDLGNHRTESPRRNPDAQPAVAEPPGTPNRGVGPAADHDRNPWRRRRKDLRVAQRDELAIDAHRLALGRARAGSREIRPSGARGCSDPPRRSRAHAGPRRRCRRRKSACRVQSRRCWRVDVPPTPDDAAEGGKAPRNKASRHSASALRSRR